VKNAKPTITIIGLGLIGGSLGLALRQADVASAIVGHDKELEASKQAKRLGAVDRTDWNLISACEQSHLVILAIPVDGIEPALKAIGPHLLPGCVVMDTATLKAPVMASVADILPEGVHFVGSTPIIPSPVEGVGLEAARADLFRNGWFCLVPPASADPQAVKLAADLVSSLGARPLFVDPLELDGMLAAVEHLPPLLALTLLDMASKQPSWRELRKLAGPSFEIGTRLVSAGPEGYSEMLLANRDNVLRWIDAFSQSLSSMRRALVDGEPEPLTQRFEAALAERSKWLRDREEGQWADLPGVEMPEKSQMLTSALFGGLWRRRQKKDRKDA
jgi:prephenate dehydrogenase